MKTYRGSPAAARSYIEDGHPRADEYYLTEGTGIAERLSASPGVTARRLAPLSGDAYEAWVAGVDHETGIAKGRLRTDGNAVRFVEVTVNGPKTWSLAAELHEGIAAAYDAAQDRAATQIVEWLAAHATTRVGPRGGQIQVPVEQIEAAVVRHRTSRAGDPHRHLHLQINSRVFAAGAWRGLHTVGVRDSLDAINGIGHAAVITDPGFRAALAQNGYTLTDDGEIAQLAPFAGAFSARAAQVARNVERYEAQWLEAHPGETPGPALRQRWDARAWAESRPDKPKALPGAETSSRWVRELFALGYVDPGGPVSTHPVRAGAIHREACVAEVLTRLAARRSGWNAADVRGEVEQLLARAQIVADASVRIELAEDLTARALDACVPLIERDGVPEHIRALTSPAVLAVEDELRSRLAARTNAPSAARGLEEPDFDPQWEFDPPVVTDSRLHEEQVLAANALAGNHDLVVIEGAAGAGKTSTLVSARDLLRTTGKRLVVVTPTLKAARVAAVELGSPASSAAALAYQYGYRWDQNGHWTRLKVGDTDPSTGAIYSGPREAAVLHRGDLVLVDEAGMLDQDTALALLTVADERGIRVALVGDRHQLSAVGRGGVLDLASAAAHDDARLTLNTVHRFVRVTDQPDGAPDRVGRKVEPDAHYAALSLAMRTAEDPAAVFDALVDRDLVRLYDSDDERIAALADTAATELSAGIRTVVIADTNDQVGQLNNAIRERLVVRGDVDDRQTFTTAAGARIGVGDRIVTRRNDNTLHVANRDTWTVAAISPHTVVVVGSDESGLAGNRFLPTRYAHEQVELGYASTVHGAQGTTTDIAHLVLGEHTGASAAYVGMTRGREHNIVHVVVDRDQHIPTGSHARHIDEARWTSAREQWVLTFAKDRADLGPAHAATQAQQEAAKYAQLRPLPAVIEELRAAWTSEADTLDRVHREESHQARLRDVIALNEAEVRDLPVLQDAARSARTAAMVAKDALQRAAEAVNDDAAGIRREMMRDWDAQRPAAFAAARTVADGPGRFGQRRGRVAEARDQLAHWSATWHPYLDAMPTNAGDVARFALRFDDRPARAEAFDRYAQLCAERLHPEHAVALAADAQARSVATGTYREYTDARRHYNAIASRLGHLAHTADPHEALIEVNTRLGRARHALEDARSRVSALTNDPAVLAAPPGTVSRERVQWTSDLKDEQQARDEARDAARPYAAGPHALRRPGQSTGFALDAVSHRWEPPEPPRPGIGI